MGQPQQETRPNQYHLHGSGISVSYYPNGTGPPTQQGPIRFTYQDAVRALVFRDDVRVVDVPDVGSIVSVTIVPTIDIGSTAFSLVVPLVVLPADSTDPIQIETKGITTVHRIFVAAIGHPQRATYTVTNLRGTASAGILPL